MSLQVPHPLRCSTRGLQRVNISAHQSTNQEIFHHLDLARAEIQSQGQFNHHKFLASTPSMISHCDYDHCFINIPHGKNRLLVLFSFSSFREKGGLYMYCKSS